MLKRSILLLIIGAFVVVNADAQNQDTWKKFKSDAGRFSVNIPCQPEIETENIKGSDETSEQVYHGCNGDDGYFMISYIDLDISAGSKSVLDKFRDGLIKGADGTLVSESSASLKSNPGRAVVLSGRAGENDVIYNWRIYLAGKRIYSIGIVTSKVNARSPSIDKFLSSFALEK